MSERVLQRGKRVKIFATYVVDGTVIEEVSGDNLLDDLLLDLLAELLSADLLSVLGGDDNGVDAEGDGGTAILLVLDGDLGLGVRKEPRESARAASRSHGSVELVGEDNGEGHELLSLVGSITEHDTLVTSTEELEGTVVETLSDIGGLLLNGNEDVAGLVVEALGRVVVADLLDGVADDLLVVDLGLGGDFTKDHDHTSLGGGLASDLGEGVLLQAGIELHKASISARSPPPGTRNTHDGVGNLVANLIWRGRRDEQ